ncbi:DNA repair protein RecO [Salinisphaera dokdonensis CL-ES53]|uniref:DNA repair protein RecO n=1 Tax=Salinisphaera dokdonensis CL-ES53 TaxID=1304272 RepID=A0ABV2B2F2_9GAMM
MRVELSPTIILHRRAWRDTSFLIEALSREHGRIGLVAKGARRPKSRWRGLLEPLAALQLSWSGRGELYTLTDIETLRRHALSGNALMAGFYACELVLRLIARDDPHPAIHDSLSALLAALSDGAPAIVALRFFERDLLDELGYGVPLDTTSDSGEAVVADADYFYDAELGLRRAHGQGQADDVRVSGAALIGLVEGRFPGRAQVHEARALMQAAIAPHLGGRPLKSVETLKAMQAFKASGSPAASAPSSGDRQ